MIRLDAASTTTASSTKGSGQPVTTITDTLVVRYVEISFTDGSFLAIIDQGTVINGVFTDTGAPLRVDVRADGSFTSRDGSWTGTVATLSAFIAGFKTAFDGFVLASGAVTGTAI
jgi:hypothetical protein